MVITYILRSIIWSIVLQMMFFFTASAQSKHAALWYLGEYCLDFNELPVKITKHKYDYDDAFYINSSGDLALVYKAKEKMVYDADNNIFEGEKIITHRAFFLPVPGNDDLVYLFCDECTAMVDIKRKTVTKVDLNSWKFDNISFYHANCHDIWLFMNNSKYLITKSEVKYCGKTDIRAISPNAELYLKTEFQQIDINNYWYDLYVGSFDRKTLKTSNEYSYKLKGYSRIYNHAFSLDNTKLLLLATNNNKMDLLQIDVKNGILDIEHYKTFCLSTKKLSVISTCFMSFGLDNKLYVYVPVLKKMVRVSFDKNGNSVFEDNFLQFSRKYYGHNLMNFVNTWFVDIPCYYDYDPCANMKRPVIIME